MARVRLEGVRKIYPDGGHVAVHGIDLEIGDGEFVVLVGPSGCGKTTTLRMIAGLETITEGALYIGDRRVNDVPPKDRDIAMVFQNYALYPHMSVRENLSFALKLRRLSIADIDARVRRAAETLGLTEILDRKPRQLSGGQRQRVALGRAIVREPQVFLFDEPLSNLDAKLRVQMRREIARLHRDLSATMIYVTHDQTEAMTLGDRIVVMNAGRVQQIDTPMALYAEPHNRFVAGFIGSPAMNFIEGEIVSDGGASFRAAGSALQIPLGADRLPARPAGSPVVLGVRPEDIAIANGSDATRSRAIVRARLEFAEPQGNETFLHVTVDGRHNLTARIAPRPLPLPESELDLSIDVGKVHLFDAATGERLERSWPVAASGTSSP
jgi:multiple sugar transport system ATP-binding protein